MYEAQFQDMGQMSIGDVTVSQKDPNLVWVGTGESNNRQSSSWGDGVYKSTDGGRTWRNMGLRNSKHINRIVIDPVDNNIVFVAATGSLWGPGGERGVYKTTDGGSDLEAGAQGPNDWTGANDLVHGARPTATSCTRRCISAAVAVLLQRRRPGQRASGSRPTAARRGRKLTTDSDRATWAASRVDVFRGSANLVYALIEAEPAAASRAMRVRTPAGARCGAAGGRARPGRAPLAAVPAQAGRGGGGGGGGGAAVAAPARPASIDRTTAARRGGG